jgi:hypothetical protein
MIRNPNPGRGKIFSLLKSVYTGYGAHTYSYLMDKEVISLGESGREFDHSPPCCAYVKDWNCIILAWAGKTLPLPVTQDIGAVRGTAAGRRRGVDVVVVSTIRGTSSSGFIRSKM